MTPEPTNSDRMRELEERVVNGYVLDDQGNWVTLEQRRKVEDEVLEQIMAGRVLRGGRWMSFEEARRGGPDVPEREAAEEETREFRN